jgi:hypothetical protein
MKRLGVFATALALTLTLSGCGGPETGDATEPSETSDSAAIITEYTTGWEETLQDQPMQTCHGAITIYANTETGKTCIDTYTQIVIQAGQLRDRLDESDADLITALDSVTATQLDSKCATVKPEDANTANSHDCVQALRKLREEVAPKVLAALSN